MIYTASWFEPQNHHGALVSISRSNPRHVSADTPKLEFFCPSAELLRRWKFGMTEETYINVFREEIKSNWSVILQWLEGLNPDIDQTLCCWESSYKGNAIEVPIKYFCHRNLVAKIVEKRRPDCFGGCDVAVNEQLLILK